MSLLQMSFAGGVLILVILILRTVFINKMPKKTFLVLWWVVLLRLLLPFAIPSGLSVYSMVRAGLSAAGLAETPAGMLSAFLPGAQTGQNEQAVNSGLRDGENENADLQKGQSETKNVFGKGNQQSKNDSLGEAGRQPDDSNFGETGRQLGKGVFGEMGQESGNGVFGETGQESKKGVYEEMGQESENGAFGEASQLRGKDDGKNISVSATQPEMAGSRAAEGRNPKESIGAENGLSGKVPGTFRIWEIIRGTGTLLCAGFFIVSYVLCRREFRMALPVRNEFLEQWMKEHPLKRTITFRCSDRVTAPLTYGILRPVIVLPGKADRVEPAQLEYIFLHEYVHICRLDAVTKLLIALALCAHWFNPFVWMMYVLFNRDIELACDEQVIRRLGMDKRASYALTLIDMEEKKRTLMPLFNGFGRNAGKNTMEERITAIMKIKKTSVCGILAATMLVASVTTVFATTAAPKSQMTDTVPGTDFTEQEYGMLLALRFEGYEDMTISEFQNKVWEMTDTEEYQDLLDRFAEDETLDNLKEENDIASFLHYCLLPLTAEKWKVRSFGGSAVSDTEGVADRAVFEYFLTLIVLDGDALKVGGYLEARAGIFAELDSWLQARSEAELQDEQKMSKLIDEEKESLHQKWDSDSLMINVESFFMPLTYYTGNEQQDNREDAELLAMALKERETQWAENLALYMPFGLSYEYDQPTDDFKMYYEGKEVRGLVDEERGLWIAEHAGIGRGIYAEDAIELYAVYENGVLQGLRAATEEEQAEWDRERQDTSDGKYEGNASEQEELRGEPGTEADYNSLFELMTSDYRELTVADFNMRLLDWTGENWEEMERISTDTAMKDFRVSMDEEERNFVTLTILLSGTENGKFVQSNYTGRKEEDPVYDRYLPEKSMTEEQMERMRSAEGGGSTEGVRSAEDVSSAEGVRSAEEEQSTKGVHFAQKAESGYPMVAWCDLYYQFSYHIADKETVTIGRRDACIGGMIQGVEDFWNETELEEMLKMTKKDIVETLQRIAAEHSDEQITITVREDFVGFEKMDERDFRY